MGKTITRLREHLKGLRAGGLSWRVIRNRFYPGVSHTLLRDIAEEGYIPRQAATCKALGLKHHTGQTWGNPFVGEAFLSPDHRVSKCAYRNCNVKFIANAPNQIYHVKSCGRKERRAKAKEERDARV